MSPVFRHGSLRLYLLRLLDEEPRHGYEVIRLLRDRFMGVYSPSPGTIYPRLARLEEEGLVTHDEADGRKVYRITDKGREELRNRSDDLSELEDEAEAEAKEQASTEFAGLVGQLKAVLDGRAYDVRVSSRLTTSPACIVANEADIDINLARRLRGSGLPTQPVLEINPEHPLVRRLNREPADPHLAEWAHVLFDQAVLTMGARLTEPAAFIGRLNDLLVMSLSADETPGHQ